MGDDADAMHGLSAETGRSGVDDVALRCGREIVRRASIPSVRWSTQVVEAEGPPSAVVTRGIEGRITVTGDSVALFFWHHLGRDPGRPLDEVHAGPRLRR